MRAKYACVTIESIFNIFYNLGMLYLICYGICLSVQLTVCFSMAQLDGTSLYFGFTRHSDDSVWAHAWFCQNQTNIFLTASLSWILKYFYTKVKAIHDIVFKNPQFPHIISLGKFFFSKVLEENFKVSSSSMYYGQYCAYVVALFLTGLPTKAIPYIILTHLC
jgi:hypothetical protein